MTEPVVIEAAINGETRPERNPNAPRKPEEIVADVFRCLDAGASILHAHAEDIRLSGRAAADAQAEAAACGLHEALERRDQFRIEPVHRVHLLPPVRVPERSDTKSFLSVSEYRAGPAELFQAEAATAVADRELDAGRGQLRRSAEDAVDRVRASARQAVEA